MAKSLVLALKSNSRSGQADSCANARHLVAGNRSAHARAAEHQSAFRFAVEHLGAHLLGDIRKINRVRIIAAHIGNLMTLRTNSVNHFALEGISGMIGTDDQFQLTTPLFII